MTMTDFERGWNACRDLCLAIAELRLQEESVLEHVLPATDEVTGEDVATQHKWFCKGREMAAANIARDIRNAKPEQQ